ncbi:YceI family protein [Paracrocinitomix mangrovi]|uniref:YceI family protein n=1 Tax=Paracrocinitomix mangrovi TaxID=2862509 RepID=UPI001C8DA857|nr:YceI family protein [Paracrocinitomix mangrovi]UKN01324.1 YceI family protein [Paracrocinitomix mangrovi]
METLTKTSWKIDPTHSEIGFKVKHMMISTVKGHFDNFDATVESSNEDFSDAKVNVSIDVNSISTKNADRDGHLKSDDFFNAAEFPNITFKSTSFDGEKMTGELSIRDITKEVVLDVDFNGAAVDPYGQTKAGFEISGEINRKDFGLSWSAVTEAGNIVVSDKVKLVIDAQFIKQGE